MSGPDWTGFRTLIKKARKDLDLRQVDVDSWSASSISRLESGSRTPKFEEAQHLARIYECPEIVDCFLDTVRLTRSVKIRGVSSVHVMGIPDEYELIEIHSHVKVGPKFVTLSERRRIRSRIDGLDQYNSRSNFPEYQGTAVAMTAWVVAGCQEISPPVWINPTYCIWPVRLNRVLGLGEEYEFEVEKRSAHMAPRYTFTPLIDGLEAFSVRITFDRKIVEPRAYLVEGIDPKALLGSSNAIEHLDLSGAAIEQDNSVYHRFTDLQIGTTFGYIWKFNT